MEKQICSLIPEDMFRQLKILSAKKGDSIKTLLIEAIQHILDKYRNIIQE